MQVDNTLDRFEREISFIGAVLKAYELERDIINRMLPLMVDLPYLDFDQQWTEQSTAFW